MIGLPGYNHNTHHQLIWLMPLAGVQLDLCILWLLHAKETDRIFRFWTLLSSWADFIVIAERAGFIYLANCVRETVFWCVKMEHYKLLRRYVVVEECWWTSKLMPRYTWGLRSRRASERWEGWNHLPTTRMVFRVTVRSLIGVTSADWHVVPTTSQPSCRNICNNKKIVADWWCRGIMYS